MAVYRKIDDESGLPGMVLVGLGVPEMFAEDEIQRVEESEVKELAQSYKVIGPVAMAGYMDNPNLSE